MEKRAYYMSLGAIVLSFITIALFFVKVSPNSVVDNMTFVSVLAAFIGISVTILLGYQIYNAIEIKDKINEIDAIKLELKDAKNKYEDLSNLLNEDRCILQARQYKNEGVESWKSFLHMLAGIRVALDINHQEDGYDWMLEELKSYMLLLNNSIPFDGTKAQIKIKVDHYRELYMDDDECIRKHPNFYIIREKYESYMNEFDKRLNNIEEMKTCGFIEVGLSYEEETEKYKPR